MTYKTPKWANPKTYDINNVSSKLNDYLNEPKKKKSAELKYTPNKSLVSAGYEDTNRQMSVAPIYRKREAPKISYEPTLSANMSYAPSASLAPKPTVNRPIVNTPLPTTVSAAIMPQIGSNNNALPQFGTDASGVRVDANDPRVQALMAQGLNLDVAIGNVVGQGGTPPTTPATPSQSGIQLTPEQLAQMQAEASAGGFNIPGYENGRPVLDANGNAIDQYYAGLNTTPRTYEQLREEERKAMQAQIDVMNEYYDTEMSKLRQVNQGRLNETSSIAVGAGLAGSPFQGAQEEKTKQFNQAEESALSARQSAEVAQAMGLADNRALQRAELEQNQANMNRQEYINHLKDIQSEARASFVNLAKAGATRLSDLSEEQLKKLMDDTGLDQLSLESIYNANLPAQQKVGYEYKELKDGTLMRIGDDGTVKSMGNYAPPSEDKGWEIKEQKDGTMVWVNNTTKQYEPISGTGGGGTGGGGGESADKAPKIVKINGVDMQWDADTGQYVPAKTAPTAQDEGALEVARTKVSEIEALINDPALNKVVGTFAFGRMPIISALTGDAQRVQGTIHQLISKETLDQLLSLKKGGGTLGALSDPERITLQNAATKLGGWEKKDSKGVGKGVWNVSENDFRAELKHIQDLAQKAIDKASGGGQQNDPLGLGYSLYQYDGTVSEDNPLGFNKVSGDTNTATGITKAKVLGNSWIDPNTNDDVECVIYARKFAPGLPRMAWSDTNRAYNAEQKRNKINSSVPKKGAVAIMPRVGFYGHVAGVKEVLPDGRLRIREANYMDNKITERIGTPQELGIEGYWTANA